MASAYRCMFLCFFIDFSLYGSFHDTISSSDYIASKGMIISEQCIGKDMEGSSSDLV
jgi:hypothetical protein